MLDPLLALLAASVFAFAWLLGLVLGARGATMGDVGDASEDA